MPVDSELQAYWPFWINKSLSPGYGLGSTPVFLRNTPAWYFDEQGILKNAGVNAPRFDHDLQGNSLGLLVEYGGNNYCLWCRDFTQAPWVKTNISAVQDQVGLDNLPNSASSLTATAPNGSVTQAITRANALHNTSFYIKRLSGSGQISITNDGGSSWTPIAVTNEWQRFELSTSQTDPEIGIQIASNGDSIAVDAAQMEVAPVGTHPRASSPILTTTASGNRGDDDCETSDLTWYTPGLGTLFMSYRHHFNFPQNHSFYSLSAGTGNSNSFYAYPTTGDIIRTRINSGGPNQLEADVPVIAIGDYQIFDYGFAFSSASSRVAVDGSLDSQGDQPVAQFPTPTQLWFGRNSNWQRLQGHVREVRYYNTRKSNAWLQSATSGGEQVPIDATATFNAVGSMVTNAEEPKYATAATLNGMGNLTAAATVRISASATLQGTGRVETRAIVPGQTLGRITEPRIRQVS